MPEGRASQIKAYRGRIARYNKLIDGFGREANLVVRSGPLSRSQRDRYLAAVNRLLLSLGEARQVLEGALAVMGEHVGPENSMAASGEGGAADDHADCGEFLPE